MLIWVCALHCEAKPVIDFYRLKKITGQSLPFDLYAGAECHCIVTGMGDQNMLRGLQSAQQYFHNISAKRWINLGIAGHKTLPLGSAVIVEQTANEATGETIALPAPKHSGFSIRPAISVSAETTDYHDDAIFDMESFRFAQHCRQQAQPENCCCIKIISDNAASKPNRNKAQISAWIADKMPQIADLAQSLQDEP